jgi:hypothetical protein
VLHRAVDWLLAARQAARREGRPDGRIKEELRQAIMLHDKTALGVGKFSYSKKVCWGNKATATNPCQASAEYDTVQTRIEPFNAKLAQKHRARVEARKQDWARVQAR